MTNEENVRRAIRDALDELFHSGSVKANDAAYRLSIASRVAKQLFTSIGDSQFRYDSIVDSLTGVTGEATVDEAMAYVSQLTADNSELHARLTLAESTRRRLEAEHNRVQNDATNKLIGVRRELSRVEAELRDLKGKP